MDADNCYQPIRDNRRSSVANAVRKFFGVSERTPELRRFYRCASVAVRTDRKRLLDCFIVCRSKLHQALNRAHDVGIARNISVSARRSDNTKGGENKFKLPAECRGLKRERAHMLVNDCSPLRARFRTQR